MLTANIDISDRLVSGQIGTVVQIHVNPNTQRPSIIYTKFEDDKAGLNIIKKKITNLLKNTKQYLLNPCWQR